jgi:hypothetical protein
VATKTDSTLTNNMSTDAHFRANASFIHDLLVTTGGWVQTSDTGQIDLTTVNKPGSTNTKAGYAIYRMDDALQATVPLFLKIYYGTARAATAFGIWFSLATSSNGSGTLNGTVYVNNDAIGTPTCAATAAATVGTIECYGSADTSRAVFEMFDHDSTGAVQLRFLLERSRSTIGAATSDGFILVWSSLSSWNKQQFIPAAGSPPVAETGVAYIQTTNTTGAYGLNVGLGIPIPLLGFAQQPGIQMVIAKTGDVAVGTVLSFSLYGTSRTFKFARNTAQQISGGASSCRVGILYE